MSDEEPELVHRERRKSGPIIIAMGLFLLSVLYVLSPPFVYLLIGEPLAVNPVCRAIYFPIIYLGGKFPLIRDFYEWYGSLFPWTP